MKKMKLFSFLLILLFFNFRTYSTTVFNIAYLFTSNFQKISNEVEVEVRDKELYFKEHITNIREQYLSEENKIITVGELNLENYDTSFFYFKKKMYTSFYPTTIDFFIQEGDGSEVSLENDPQNQFQTKPVKIEGGKKYKITSIGSNLKNTVNLKEGEFSLEAFESGQSLGEVKISLLLRIKFL